MNISELLTSLTQQGVAFSIENDTLSIRSPKGVVTPALKAELTAHKAEILALLRQWQGGDRASLPLDQGLSLKTIGRLIGGSSVPVGQAPRAPVTDPLVMARSLTVTFRPLPKGYQNSVVLQFRTELEAKLRSYGVTVLPWQEATKPFRYEIELPLIPNKITLQTRLIKSSVNAVIDVERPASLRQMAESTFAEGLYRFLKQFLWPQHSLSIARIAKVTAWAEEHAAKYVENPTDTQIIILTPLDPTFVSPDVPYQKKIGIGINKLIQTFSEIVVGVSGDRISILNMNLSDSLFSRDDLDRFTLKSLIPKVFVPIAPLFLNQFEVSDYAPQQSPYAARLVTLGQEIAATGLLPPGFKLKEVIKRQSHQDIVDIIVNGRTGVSYGFIAYVEPPSYVGAPEISAADWETLAAIPSLSTDEVRQNPQGRRYAKIKVRGTWAFRQIPDIWLVSARSGANKTSLHLERDVLRIGLSDRLQLQIPQGLAGDLSDIKPSYDIYVMVAIALSAALYVPQLVAQGAPIAHFHGYPAADWFQAHEYCTGIQNPSVPCGTYESGIFNFLGISSLADQPTDDLSLVGLVEPDHGTNIIARDLSYLVQRLHEGCQQGQIELGGRHFASLREMVGDRPTPSTPPSTQTPICRVGTAHQP